MMEGRGASEGGKAPIRHKITRALTAPPRGVARAVRAASKFVFPGRTAYGRYAVTATTWSEGTYYGSDVNYRTLIGDGTKTSALMAVVGWSARTFPEAPVVVERLSLNGGNNTPLPNHPLVQLVERPNPHYSGVLLWMATRVDWLMTGNAYWLKIRQGDGRPIGLWWLPSMLVEPRWPDNGTSYLSHYDYYPTVVNGAQSFKIPVEDIVHYRYGLDPHNPRKGMSPVGAVLREIFTDEEAANYSATVLRNLGMPGLIIAPRGEDVELTDEDAEDLKEKAKERFGGDKRGEPMVTQAPVDIHVLGWNPAQMNLRDLRRIPEERITAALGVPAIVVGLGAGLDRSTFANFEEARQAAYESHILPDQRLFAAELRTQLLPDFADIETHTVAFDTSGIRVLQDDVNALYARAGDALTRGAITINDYLSMVGLPTKPDGDVYLRQIQILVTPVSDSAEEAVALTQQSQTPMTGAPPPEEEEEAEEEAPEREAAGYHPAMEYKAASNPALRLVPPMRRALEAFFRDQQRRYIKQIMALDSLEGVTLDWPATEKQLLSRVLKPYQHAGLELGWRNAAELITGPQRNSLTTSHNGKAETREKAEARESVPALPDWVWESLAVLMEIRIAEIDSNTRDSLLSALNHAVNGALTPGQLAIELETIFAWSAGRASTVAMTEMVNAMNQGQAYAWESFGVDRVAITDGDGCGWTDHDDPDLADGSIRTMAEYRDNPLAHPNCVREAHPVIAGRPL